MATSSTVKVDWSKVDNPELILQRFPSRRSIVYGTKGVVSSSQPLATEAGLEILRKGGNAAKSCYAPDAFCLFYDATTRSVKALNGSGRAPGKLSIEYLRSRGITGDIPPTDLNAVTVPGAAAAWVDTVEVFGSGKLSVAEVLEPATRLAEEGVPVSEIHSYSWQRSEDLIKNASPNGHEMLLDGKAPLPGQIMKFPNLAKTFRALAEHGKVGFYKGRIAEAIVEVVKSKGGVMELEDLEKHTGTFVEPIKYTYGGEVTVYECPPNGQGITALIALGILESIQEQGLVGDLLKMDHNSAEYLHTLVEALRLTLYFAIVDSQYYVTDPDVQHVPVEELLSRDYLASRAALFNPKKADPRVIHGNPVQSSDTVYFSVTDQWGNACSFIQSNYSAVPKGCGFTLQNRGAGFVLKEGHPNALKGGKRPYHTIIPALATRGDDLFMSYGVMGGFMQPQGHVQVLLNMLRGFSPQAAVDAPRFCISTDTSDASSSEINSEVYFEEGISPDTVEKLRAMGHDARILSGFARGMFGRGQVIQKIKDKSGRTVWAAGSDPRADGHAGCTDLIQMLLYKRSIGFEFETTSFSGAPHRL
ncbi:gamma-glutamyltranspeptidase [Lactarius akahatsu]|uniref:Gamma-glutamyltranspeptidase n=1 Tax=Lactarius akahatsu TaxID=416441 RepID=A0AAD4LP20_9AGAM|nr:gamma-glutamyltranspeptidase [Lactarius akahatsu]